MSKIAIVDYALGNLFNVQRMFKYLNIDAVITKKEDVLRSAERIVLPGVGAFAEGMKHLRANKLDMLLCDLAKEGRPILGICLGMQILMTESQEHGISKGLDLIPGKVVYFSPSTDQQDRYKIPQIGWNKIFPSQADGKTKDDVWAGTILEGVSQNAYMYFVHSLYVSPDDEKFSLSRTEYGENSFCSVIKKDNVVGCQFHPERSGDEGLQIFKNFVSLCY